ncbi:killer cell lectin-like receptor subfamily B member 1F isoform X2 [Apodemus sylvaticus]|uniref:killer cell lectin-like receptor subfamily B member 1F isoform X2 n=1 Tax=Apodemus sylvaticus TaxID=10129 RepID=UPI002244A73D|nr:killer cell lectin-like receptor subfamily B member 1F isoform X2 [Apodemus sylvaticus]
MDTSRVYDNVKTFRSPGYEQAPFPSLSPDACRCPHWHHLALKLGCTVLILLLFSLIGLSVLVRFLVQKPSIEKCSTAAQENRTELTGRSAILECPRNWHSHRNKCLFISQISRPWAEGRDACSMIDATLLLIENKEELRFIQNIIRGKEQLFFIGLNYVQEKKIWKWTNGSILNTDHYALLSRLRITGKDEENSCAIVSHTEVFSDSCSSDNHWICQKTLKHV